MRAAMSSNALAGRVLVGRAMRGAAVMGHAVLGLGCQTAPAPRVVTVTVQDQLGTWSLTRTAVGCETDRGDAIVVGGDVATSGDWRLAPGPVGRELTDHGALVARIVDGDGDGRRSYVDPTGVPLGRITMIGDAGTITGPARTTLGTVTREAQALRWTDANGHLAGTIAGTDDLELGLALVAPSVLPQAARALVACVRLSAVTSSPAK